MNPMLQPINMSPREIAAMQFATERHEGQENKYTGEIYVIALQSVVDIVRSVPHTEEMLLAAWSHGLLNDTQTTASELRHVIGGSALELVLMLTHPPQLTEKRLMREVFHEMEQLGRASPQAKTIRLASILHNVRSMTDCDPAIARPYLYVNFCSIDRLFEGDRGLLRQAFEQIRKASVEIAHRTGRWLPDRRQRVLN